jgi:ankyrin repeat protein
MKKRVVGLRLDLAMVPFVGIRGPVLATPSPEAQSSLIGAAAEGNAAIVRAALYSGADPNSQNRETHDVPDAAGEGSHANVVKVLISAGADANSHGRRGMTALMLAASHGYADVAKQPLDAGSDVSATLPRGESHLIMAAKGGHTEALKVLVAAGADINARLATSRSWLATAPETMRPRNRPVSPAPLLRWPASKKPPLIADLPP